MSFFFNFAVSVTSLINFEKFNSNIFHKFNFKFFLYRTSIAFERMDVPINFQFLTDM